ncbi:MAG: GNAT family N-acetyltransferase [candidate division Zixibacteria bacterium]|nr:GNAT family N-acetyltransferase [candidate division Zixibacteria bacterium]
MVADGPEIETIRQLFLEYADSLGFSLCFQSFESELAALPGDYASPDGRLYLAKIDGIPVGCVAVHKIEPGVCEIKRLYVRPAYRGLSLGRKLAVTAISAAREIGYDRMRLDTLKSMVEAHGLYRSLGFRDIPPYRLNPLPEAVYMELTLDESETTSNGNHRSP